MERPEVKYLLDTAPWINGVALPQVIPDRVRRSLQVADTTAVCSISLLETAILHRLGRLQLAGTLQEFFAAALANDVQVIELDPAIALKTNELPPNFQGDPFDRTIVATAAVLNLTLVTTDAAIRDARACKVEFYPFRPQRSR